MKIDELVPTIYSKAPVIIVETHEEHRFIKELIGAIEDNVKVFINGTDEIKTIDEYEKLAVTPTVDFVSAVNSIAGAAASQRMSQTIRINLFKNIDLGENDPGRARCNIIKDMIPTLQASYQIMMFMMPVCQVANVLSRDYTLFQYSLMDSAEIEAHISAFLQRQKVHVQKHLDAITWVGGKLVAVGDAYKLDYTPDYIRQVASVASGLTINELDLAIAKSFKVYGRLDKQYIQKAKKSLIEKSGLLEWHEPIPMSAIGGLDNIKEWIQQRVPSVLSEDAAKYGLTPPRGMLIMGLPGTGKSLISKAVASTLGVSLIGLVVGKIMDRFVGGSEANMIAALKVIEANAPCVVWIDEVEKSLTGVQSSGYSDSGTFARVFGILLTWLQERKAPVFLVATCNAMLGPNNQLMIPPEFQRAGRIDKIWWVDVPTPEEAVEIFKIHLSKVGRNPSKFDLEYLSRLEYVPQTAGGKYRYTGAEIEQAISDALFRAYNDNKRELTTDDIAAALKDTIPVAFFMRETLTKLRTFGLERCTPASRCSPARAKTSVGQQGGSRLEL